MNTLPGGLTALWPAGLGIAHYIAMGCLVLAGACLQGVGGLGFAMFCAPIAALFFPELVPAPILVLGCPLAGLAAVREFRAIDWPVAGHALAGRVAGAAMAAWVVQLLSAHLAAVLFAVLILIGVGLSLAGWRLPTTRLTAAGAGVASGLMGTITSAGAPPLALVMTRFPPAPLRSTLGIIFFLGSVISLVALASVGRAQLHHLVLGATLLPWLLAGFALSAPIARRMSAAAIRNALLALAAFGSLGILAQTALPH